MPGGTAGRPHIVEERHLAKGIHRLPEAMMAIDRQLALGGELLQQGFFERDVFIGTDQFKGPLVEYKEPTIDPTVGDLRFLLETGNPIVFDGEFAET